MSYALGKCFKMVLPCFIFLAAISTYAADPASQSRGVFPEPARVTERSEYKIHTGLLMGVQRVEGSDYDTAPVLGLDVGFQPYIPFGVGAELNYSKNNARYEGKDTERTVTLVKGSYNFGGDIPVISKSYVGLGAGTAFLGDGDTDFILAPLVGFDYPFSMSDAESMSAGLQLKYMQLSGTQDALTASAALKYWF